MKHTIATDPACEPLAPRGRAMSDHELIVLRRHVARSLEGPTTPFDLWWEAVAEGYASAVGDDEPEIYLPENPRRGPSVALDLGRDDER